MSKPLGVTVDRRRRIIERIGARYPQEQKEKETNV